MAKIRLTGNKLAGSGSSQIRTAAPGAVIPFKTGIQNKIRRRSLQFGTQYHLIRFCGRIGILRIFRINGFSHGILNRQRIAITVKMIFQAISLRIKYLRVSSAVIILNLILIRSIISGQR